MLEKKKLIKEELLASSENLETQLTTPITEVEFDQALDQVAIILLFGTKWEPEFLTGKKKRADIPILNDLPLKCKAGDCAYASKCNVLSKIPKSEWPKLIGTDCRSEKIFGVEQFSQWVHSLDISPDNAPDILNVASLIRLIIYKRRIDWDIAIAGDLQVQEFGGTDVKGNVYWNRTPSKLLEISEKINKQIVAIQNQLAASRKAQLELFNTLGTGKRNPFLDALESMKGKTLQEDDFVDAEFDDDL